MRRSVFPALASLAPYLFCTLAFAQAMERPELHEQDNWSYSLYEGGSHAPGNFEHDESFTVMRVLPPDSTTRYEISRSLTDKRSGETKQNTYRISPDHNVYGRQSPALPWQEVRWVQWPLEPGRSWRFERPIASGIQVWEARVKGWEEIEVPAGKFRTIRVEIDLVSNPNPLTWRATFWYSPQVKTWVKKTDYGVVEASRPIRRDTRELTNYTLH